VADELELTDNELLNESSEVLDDEIIEPEIKDSKDAELELKDEEEDEDEKKEKLKTEADEKDKDKDKPFPFERPSISEIKAKFPDFFKEFPQFRDVVFQEIEYRKIYPTIEDAREALEDSRTLDGLRESVLQGKSEDIFEAISQTDKGAAEKFALTFLPTLYAKNKDLYVSTINPLLENLVRQLGKTGNENSKNAALVVANFLWGDNGEDIVEGKKTNSKSLEESEDAKSLRLEREKDANERLGTFTRETIGEMKDGLARLISRGLDVDGTMSDYAKKTLTQDIIMQVDEVLKKDANHMNVMNSRWLHLKKEGYNTASKEKLVSAYLSRAKQVIPSIRDKARNDFLGVKKKVAEKKIEEIDRVSSRSKEVTSGRGNGTGAGAPNVVKPSRELYRKMTDLEILNTN